MKTVAIFGGDRRQELLAGLLRANGITAKLIFSSDRRGFDSVPALINAVILPIPFSRDGRTLNAPACGEAVPLAALEPYLAGKTVIGGALTRDYTDRLISLGSVPFDLLCREEFAVFNAVATAEGAVELALAQTETTLFSAECLVTGYGRIARLLADRLKAFGANVTVAARKPSDLVWIAAAGMRAIRVADIAGDKQKYDLVFNTVPAPIIADEQLESCRAGCLVVELASAPGGVDRQAAERHGIRLVAAPGLPGKTAPVSTAEAMAKTVLNIFKEQDI